MSVAFISSGRDVDREIVKGGFRGAFIFDVIDFPERRAEPEQEKPATEPAGQKSATLARLRRT